MLRKSFPILIVAALASAGCGDRVADDAMQRDTTLQVVPDTQLVERTTTFDTIRDPDLGRDTLGGDTLRRDTTPR